MTDQNSFPFEIPLTLSVRTQKRDTLCVTYRYLLGRLREIRLGRVYPVFPH